MYNMFATLLDTCNIGSASLIVEVATIGEIEDEINWL